MELRGSSSSMRLVKDFIVSESKEDWESFSSLLPLSWYKCWSLLIWVFGFFLLLLCGMVSF